MIATLFRWRVVAGKEQKFEAAWASATVALKAHGSAGSALFVDDQGNYCALARWPDRATRDRAFAADPAPAKAAALRECVAETIERTDMDERENLWGGVA